MANFPNFEQAIRERVVDRAFTQHTQPGYGIVLRYFRKSNTAHVLMSQQGSDEVGEIFPNVPCPTNIGIQLAEPEPGRPCWVAFRDGVNSRPYIINFFNPSYEDIDYDKQYRAENNVPRFMMEL